MCQIARVVGFPLISVITRVVLLNDLISRSVVLNMLL